MSKDQENGQFKVAIIGAGIGGASTAFFLREKFGQQVGITLFEQSGYIGGRIKSITYAGKVVEAGAGLFIGQHTYMHKFVNRFGLQLDHSMGKTSHRYAMYDGPEKGIIFSTLRNFYLVAITRNFLHNRIPLVTIRSDAIGVNMRIADIYGLQSRGECFTTPADLIKAVLPSKLKLAKSRFTDWLDKRHHKPGLMKEELVHGVISNFYCQDLNIHAVSGYCAMLMNVGITVSVQGGNQLIPEKLVEFALEGNPEGSPKEFVHAQVTRISPEDNQQYRIEYVPHESSETQQELFDYVVIAAPLHQNSSIKTGGDIQLPSYQYLPVDKTFVAGDLKRSVFGFTTSSFARNIWAFIVPTQTAYAQNLCYFRSLVGIPERGTRNYIWVSSTESSRVPNPESMLTDNYVDNTGPEAPLKVSWLGFPVYQALTRARRELGTFVLAPRLYYPNAIELLASTMEMAIIGARNVALLIAADRRENS